MSTFARVRAQAKVNLFLRVLAREASGYHGLETLFARLDLADDITVRIATSGRSIDCHGADVGPPADNLAFRAAVLYAETTGWPAGFAIEVEKRIPVGGGLGGGSADAGAVLRALNALAPTPAHPGTLMAMAGRLGADVPFLTSDAALALAWNRGDRLLELPALPPRDLVLACFPFGVSSAEAFGWVAAARNEGGAEVGAVGLHHADLGTWEGVGALAANDFEDEVGRRHPQIAGVLEAARGQRPLLAGLTGSGSTVVIVPRIGFDPGEIPLPSGVSLLRTRTAVSVEDVLLTG